MSNRNDDFVDSFYERTSTFNPAIKIVGKIELPESTGDAGLPKSYCEQCWDETCLPLVPVMGRMVCGWCANDLLENPIDDED